MNNFTGSLRLKLHSLILDLGSFTNSTNKTTIEVVINITLTGSNCLQLFDGIVLHLWGDLVLDYHVLGEFVLGYHVLGEFVLSYHVLDEFVLSYDVLDKFVLGDHVLEDLVLGYHILVDLFLGGCLIR